MDFLEEKRALKNKWVIKLKTREDDCPPRYKAHIVVKGLQQKKDVDFEEILALVMKMAFIQVVLRLTTCVDLEIEHLM